MNILCLNAGSSTLKYKLFAMPDETVLAEGSLDYPKGEGIAEAATRAMDQCRPMGIGAVGHRMVHGGASFTEPARVTGEMLDDLRSLEELDPLHNPTEVEMIAAGLKALPDVPAVAVFDTSFHKTIPEVAWRYAIPYAEADRDGIRRYGFHGISYRYVSDLLLQKMNREPQGTRLVICHLGSGASVCAVRDGKSVDTSMGMTPLEGLVMGTRCGDIDPGALLYLLRRELLTCEQLDDLLNHRSGLFGLSGCSSDLREVEENARKGDQRSEMAMEIFAYRVRRYIGAYAAVLGGLDALAFTGGIGEHSAGMRSRICRGLSFLGIRLDAARNDAAAPPTRQIGEDGALVETWVLATDEERQIARDVFHALA